MPRKRQTQKPMTAGLEAGASYGQVGENLTSQNPNAGGIPLPQDRAVPTPGSPAPAPTGAGPVPPSGGSPPQGGTGALPLEDATNFVPNVTPLTSPGRGFNAGAGAVERDFTVDTVALDLVNSWAKVSDDPTLKLAAQQMSMRPKRGR